MPRVWHVDLYATSPQSNLPSLLPVPANTPSTSISPADKWIADCIRLVGLDHLTTVDSPSTDPYQRPCAAMSLSTYRRSPIALLPSLTPSALSAFQDPSVPQQ